MLLAKGAHKVYMCYLVSLVAAIIAAAGSFIFSGALLALTGGEGGASPEALAGAVAGFFAALATALILYIVAFYMLYKGFKILRDYGAARYSIGVTGSKLIVIGLIIMLVAVPITVAGAFATFTAGSATAILGGMLISLGVLVLGALTALIGAVMILIGIWRLGEEPGGGLIKAGIIIWFIGFIISTITAAGSIIAFISSIPVMLGARNVRDQALTQTTQTS